MDNVNARMRWREAVTSRGVRNAPANKGTFPFGAYNGLIGDWDYPILSKEEMREHTLKSHRRLSYFFVGSIISGVTSLILAFYIEMNSYFITIGIISILFGSLFMVISHWNVKWLEKDVHRETSATWKIVGYETTVLVIEEFLSVKGLAYRKEVTEWSKSLYNNPEYKYILNNGNYISSLYSEISDGHVYRWLNIGYTSSNYIQAKTLQRDLDEFLAKRDLIRRVS